MDVYCVRCGEPWDLCGELVEMLGSDGLTLADFRSGVGCPSCIGCSVDSPGCADIYLALYGVLGDDMDGAASLFDDFGLL